MQPLTQLPRSAQLGIIVLVITVLSVTSYFVWLRKLEQQNEKDEITLKTKRAELAQLAPYRTKLADLNAQTSALEAQMEAQKHIVPEEKEVPKFITLVANEAVAAGVEVRRYTPRDQVAKEYYIEVPFDVDVDGPYFSVLNFYDRLQHLERIVNVNKLAMSALKGGRTPVRKTYKWAPNETVVASSQLTTFYSVNKNAAPAGKNVPPPAPPVKK